MFRISRQDNHNEHSTEAVLPRTMARDSLWAKNRLSRSSSEASLRRLLSVCRNLVVEGPHTPVVSKATGWNVMWVGI